MAAAPAGLLVRRATGAAMKLTPCRGLSEVSSRVSVCVQGLALNARPPGVCVRGCPMPLQAPAKRRVRVGGARGAFLSPAILHVVQSQLCQDLHEREESLDRTRDPRPSGRGIPPHAEAMQPQHTASSKQSKIFQETSALKRQGPEPLKFAIGKGQLLAVATAAAPFITRLGMGAFNYGYSVSLQRVPQGDAT